METGVQETKQQQPEDINRPLNLLYISSWYPTQQQPTLGIFVRRHAQAAALHHTVTLVHATADSSMKEGEFRIEKHEEGRFRELILYYGKVKTGTKWLRRWKNWQLLKTHYRFGVEKAIEYSGPFDLLHLNIPWPLGSIARQLSRELAIPYVVTEHWTGYDPEDGRYKGALVKQVTKRTCRDAAAIVPVCMFLREQMERHGIRGNYTILPNVVDTGLFVPGKTSPEETRFIHVSSLDERQKNVSGILRAFHEARKSEPSLKLVIIGSGSDENALKRLSNELGLTQRGVDFKGQLGEEELVQELQNSSALVINSRFENQPVVILEALSCGLPVIAGRIAAIDELVAPEYGILFEPGNEAAFTEALLEMHRQKHTFNQTSIRTHAVERYSPEAVTARLDKLYREVIAGWGS